MTLSRTFVVVMAHERFLRLVARRCGRRSWLAAGIAVGGLAGLLTIASVRVLPPSVQLRQLGHATATTQLLIAQRTPLSDTRGDPVADKEFAQAAELADMTASPEVRGYIASAAGIPVSKIAIDPPLWANLPRIEQWDTGEKRSYQLVYEGDPYRLTFDLDTSAPLIDVTAQGPTTAATESLAQGAANGISSYLSHAEAAAGGSQGVRYEIRQVSPVTASSPSRFATMGIGLFIFFVVLAIWVGLVLFGAGCAADLRAAIGSSSEVRLGIGRSSDSRVT